MSWVVSKETRSRLVADILLALTRLALFAGLSREELGELAREVEVSVCQPHERIFEQASDGETLHFVLEGGVELLDRSPDGTEHLVARAERGDAFGEIGFILGSPRTLSAVNGPAETVQATLSRLDFDRIAELRPAIGLAVHRQLLETIASRLNELPAVDRNHLLGHESRF